MDTPGSADLGTKSVGIADTPDSTPASSSLAPEPCWPGEVSLEPSAATLHAVAGSHAFLSTEDDPAPRAVILMAGGDYLGLGTHPAVMDDAVRAIRRYGWGTGSGAPHDPWHAAHAELERRLAEFAGAEEALLFPSRYGALVAAMPALLRPGDLLLLDAPGNEALAEGGHLAGARVEICRHHDPEALIRRLKKAASRGASALVATEGVFGLDGRLACLEELVDAALETGARLLVDDSHGLGVTGPTGRGSAEARGVHGEIEILAGCLGGFLGGTGAFLAGKRSTIASLRRRVRERLDSPPPPAAASVSALSALRVLGMEPELRARLWRNICFMREGLRARGFDTGPVESALIPIVVGSDELLLLVKDWLLRRGLYVAHLSSPLVEPTLARLRLTIKAHQTEEDLVGALETFEEAGRRFSLAG